MDPWAKFCCFVIWLSKHFELLKLAAQKLQVVVSCEPKTTKKGVVKNTVQTNSSNTNGNGERLLAPNRVVRSLVFCPAFPVNYFIGDSQFFYSVLDWLQAGCSKCLFDNEK